MGGEEGWMITLLGDQGTFSFSNLHEEEKHAAGPNRGQATPGRISRSAKTPRPRPGLKRLS